MIRRFLIQTVCEHAWRELYLPRFFNGKHQGAMDCTKCGKFKLLKRRSSDVILRDVVAATEDIGQNWTLAKAERLESLWDEAKEAIDYRAPKAPAKPTEPTLPTQGDAK